MKNPRLAWIALALVLSLVPAGRAVPGPGTLLVRIDKTAASALPAEERMEIRAVTDLGDSWLALIGADTADRLAGAAVIYEVVDRHPAGKAYFLVRLSGGGGFPDLLAYGPAYSLGGSKALFWTNGEEARGILPARWTLARLGLDQAPSLETRLAQACSTSRPTEAFAYDPAIASLVAQVSRSRITSTITDLQGFRTRYTSTPSCEAAGTYLYGAFAATGLPVEYDPFSFSRGRYSSRNVVATMTGQSSPDNVVIVCAHYDSYSDQPTTSAPGADDNGSGAASVLEIARILAGRPFDYTIRFIAFSAEEWGFYGSQHYAQAAKARGDKILAVLNLDMVGIPDPYADRLDVVVNSSSSWLFDRYTQAASAYASMRTREILDNSWEYSDQWPFWESGINAICGIENEDPTSPYYHTVNDVVSTLNPDYNAAVAKASLAAAADLARPVSTPRTPSGLQARSQVVSSLFSAIKTVSLRWTANTDAIAGYHVYRASVSGGPYQKIDDALVQTTAYVDRRLDPARVYYYVVTAVDALGRESRSSLEAADSPNGWLN